MERDLTELGNLGVPRPEAAAPHQRFFKDGEEPPARYDLPDVVDYIVGHIPQPIKSSRWRRLAWAVCWRGYGNSVGLATCYYLGALVSLVVGCLPLFAFVSPVAHAFVTRHALIQLTGNASRFGRIRPWRRSIALTVANAPALVTQILMFVGIIALCVAIAPTVSHVNAAICAGTTRFHPLPWDWFLVPIYLLAAFTLVAIQAYLTVRISGFATHLILDYDLEPFQAIRANWRVTRGSAWQLTWLKIRAWFVQYFLVFCPYMIVLLPFIEPYVSAVWTAAYLYIAGSEPPIDEFEAPAV
jgi:hypothetical protein